MDGDATGLWRDALADVLAALSVLDHMTEEEHQRVVRAFVGPHWPFSAVSTRWESGPCSCDWITTDPREAMELLQVRGLAPEDDERRGFDVRECSGEEPGPVCTCGGVEVVRGVPGTIPDTVAYASLSVPTILRAEELARETVARLRPWGAPQPERVVWRVGARTEDRNQRAWKGAERHLLCTGFVDKRIGPVSMWPDGECKPAHALWEMGLQLDSITADAVTIVVPPIGGDRG